MKQVWKKRPGKACQETILKGEEGKNWPANEQRIGRHFLCSGSREASYLWGWAGIDHSVEQSRRKNGQWLHDER
jgi:hypothetical protein